MRLAIALVGLLATARPASAEIDWARGLVTADGIGVADRHAPSPAVARGTSRRAAEDAARRRIAAQLPELAVAGGHKLAEKLKDSAIKARIAQAVDNAFAVTAEPETDGAWRVTMAVPIEAVRQAIAGPRELPKAGDAGPPVVIVDGLTSKPAVGALAAATVWVKDVPAWAKDAPHITAHELAGITVAPATLYVIVAK